MYTFRKLKSTDVFLMVNILNKIGVAQLKSLFDKDSIKDLIGAITGDKEKKTSEDILTTVGFNIAVEAATIVFNNLPKCENDIYSILAETSDLSIDDVKNLEINVFFEMIIDFFKKDEFKDFIKVASKFLK